ncbi:hypothetical protein BKA67DRAFT_120003 [Truncatella angustata]|uniref:Uncharacterized protein n=1 Tax=Truncatella angustata TaxID=152316 RepID=A0A9P8UB71_9PEZI|nr:uncharacterized protein BKA67DRAFT_120003 [Truncatella angustata]KAH6645617.1 hypothetical protein BKA67DRAFT_120003 [Truncatella angustata]
MSRRSRARQKRLESTKTVRLANNFTTLNNLRTGVTGKIHPRVKDDGGMLSSPPDRKYQISATIEQLYKSARESKNEQVHSLVPLARCNNQKSTKGALSTPATTTSINPRYLAAGESTQGQDHTSCLPDSGEVAPARHDAPKELGHAFAHFRTSNPHLGWSEIREVLLQAREERRMSEVGLGSTSTKFWTLWDIERAQTILKLRHSAMSNGSVTTMEHAGNSNIGSSLLPRPEQGRHPYLGHGDCDFAIHTTTPGLVRTLQKTPQTRTARRKAKRLLHIRNSELESQLGRASSLAKNPNPSPLRLSLIIGHDEQDEEHVLDRPSDVTTEDVQLLRTGPIDDVLVQDKEILPWITIQLNALSDFPASEGGVERLLRVLTIEQIYDRMLTVSNWRQYARQMFTVLYCAKRDLNALETLDALRVQISLSHGFGPKHVPDEAEAHCQMTNICFTLMLQSRHNAHTGQVQKKYPFVGYATEYWSEHLMKSACKAHIDDQFSQLFCGLDNSFSTWTSVWNINIRAGESQQDKLVFSLYYAALLGLTNVIAQICAHIDSRADMDLAQFLRQRGGSYGTALEAASSRNHTQAVELLRQKKCSNESLKQKLSITIQNICSS